MTSDQFLLILVIAGLAAVIKSIAGFGYPLLMLPILAQIIDVVDAVLIIAPSNLVLNFGIAWKLREHRERATTLNVFMIAGIVGSVVGTLVLPLIPEQAFRLLLFAILVAFLFNRLSSFSFTMTDPTAKRFAPLVGGVAGVFQGATGVSGPVVTPWFLSVDIDRDTFIFAIASFFTLTQVGQLGVAAAGDLFTQSSLLIGLALIPLSLVSLPIGAAIRERISVTAFENLVIGLLAVSALTLLVRLL